MKQMQYSCRHCRMDPCKCDQEHEREESLSPRMTPTDTRVIVMFTDVDLLEKAELNLPKSSLLRYSATHCQVNLEVWDKLAKVFPYVEGTKMSRDTPLSELTYKCLETTYSGKRYVWTLMVPPPDKAPVSLIQTYTQRLHNATGQIGGYKASLHTPPLCCAHPASKYALVICDPSRDTYLKCHTKGRLSEIFNACKALKFDQLDQTASPERKNSTFLVVMGNSTQHDIEELFKSAKTTVIHPKGVKAHEKKTIDMVERQDFVLIKATNSDQLAKIPALIVCQEAGMLPMYTPPSTPGGNSDGLYIDLSTQVGIITLSVTRIRLDADRRIVFGLMQNKHEYSRTKFRWDDSTATGIFTLPIPALVSPLVLDAHSLFIRFTKKHLLSKAEVCGEYYKTIAEVMNDPTTRMVDETGAEIAIINVKVALFHG